MACFRYYHRRGQHLVWSTPVYGPKARAAMTALAAADAAPSTGDASDAARPRVRHLATETFVTVKFDIVTDLNEAGFVTAQAFLDVVTERFTEAVSSGEWRERIFRKGTHMNTRAHSTRRESA